MRQPLLFIPKIKISLSLKDYRPISLCNVIYKIIAKCLVNSMRSLLQDIISPTQSAFISGHIITDNAPIAFECIYTLPKGSINARNFCAYKLELMMAYDRVVRAFLESAMRKLGVCKYMG